MKILLPIFFVLAMMPSSVFAANQLPPPGYDTDLPGEYATGQGHLPQYLPSGAVNLDEAWIEDGGARLYWNSVYIPTQLKLAGETWVDPALVPLLILEDKQPAPRKKYYRPVRRRVTKAKVPANASSTALTPPGIPLPVTPVPDNQVPIPALKPQTSKSVQKTNKAMASTTTQQSREEPGQVEVPRLQ